MVVANKRPRAVNDRNERRMGVLSGVDFGALSISGKTRGRILENTGGRIVLTGESKEKTTRVNYGPNRTTTGSSGQAF